MAMKSCCANCGEMGWVAIILSCDVVGNVRDLSAEGAVEGIIGRPPPKVFLVIGHAPSRRSVPEPS